MDAFLRPSASSPQAVPLTADSTPPSIQDPLTENSSFTIQLNRLSIPGLRPISLPTKKHKESYVWRLGARLINPAGKKYWLCEQCHTRKKHSSHLFQADGIANIKNHLLIEHAIDNRGEKVEKQPIRLPVHEAQSYLYNRQISKSWKALYICWIIKQDITFNQAVSGDLRELFRSLNPSSVDCFPTHHNTPRSWIVKAFNDKRADITNILQKAQSNVNISFDLWSSPFGISLLGITAHFIDEKYTVHTALLGLRDMTGSHSGEHIAQAVESTVNSFNLGRKLGYFVLDNATNNDTAVQQLVTTFGLDPQVRLRCLGHIINLVATAILTDRPKPRAIILDSQTLEETQQNNSGDLPVLKQEDSPLETSVWERRGVVEKLHNIVTFINRSPGRRSEFKKLQERLDDTQPMIYQLLNDGGIRWNAAYLMIQRALKLKDAINLYVSPIVHANTRQPAKLQSSLAEDQLQQEDWDELHQYQLILQHFYEHTKRTEGIAKQGSYGALWEVVVALTALEAHLRGWQEKLQADETANPNLVRAIDRGFKKLQKYLDEVLATPAYAAAAVLHPRLKYSFFERKWINHAVRPYKAYLHSLKNNTRLLWEAFRSSSPQTTSLPDDESPRKRRRTAFDRFIEDDTLRERTKDELERYLKIPQEVDEIPNLITWWEQHQVRFPQLSRLAIHLFSVPAMSSECERVFSQCKKMVTDERNRLLPDIIEAQECLKNWLLHDLVVLNDGDFDSAQGSN